MSSRVLQQMLTRDVMKSNGFGGLLIGQIVASDGTPLRRW